MITIYENSTGGLTKEIKEKRGNKRIGKVKTKRKKDFSVFMEKFLSEWESSLIEKEDIVGPKVNISEVLGQLARVYEKIRTTIEYKGEHVLRRNAIERILKRLVWEQGSVRSGVNAERVSETLIKELVWARYLPNNTIPQRKVKDVEDIIYKYLYLLRNLDNIPKGVKTSTVRDWIWGVASSEIEDFLDPSNRELFVKLMYGWFKSYFEWEDDLDSHEKEIQLNLAIHRAYTKSDESIMRYHLLLKEIPSWQKAEKEKVNNFILNFPKIYQEIEKHLDFKGKHPLYRRVQKEVAAFEIYRDIALSHGVELRILLKNKEIFNKEIVDVCEFKYKQTRKKVSTGIVRSIIYIFITKVFLALLIEVPYEIIRFNEVRYFPLGINIILPPFFMWIIGLSIKTPGAKNTQNIIYKLETVVYPSVIERKSEFGLFKTKKRSALLEVFGLLYSLLFIGVFGGITYLLLKANFTFIGIGIFFVFLSMVLLFAFRIRHNANVLKVDIEEENIFDHILNFLSLPFLNLGFFLSKGLAKLNFLTIILDFLIEAPLKSVIEIFEEWINFLKKKKEEVVEVPDQ